jgi:hypothetical protein
VAAFYLYYQQDAIPHFAVKLYGDGLGIYKPVAWVIFIQIIYKRINKVAICLDP